MTEITPNLFGGPQEDPQELVDRWRNCGKCPQLARHRKQVVFWDGAPKRPVLVVGQWPGKDEDQTGVPFQGELGDLCREMIGKYIPNRFCTWTNILGCRVTPETPYRSSFADNCSPLLEAKIDLLDPKLIIALGRIAISRFVGVAGAKVSTYAGKSAHWRGRQIFYSQHPASYLRIENKRDQEEARQEIDKQLSQLTSLWTKMRHDL